jgi:GAF domain-containing protein
LTGIFEQEICKIDDLAGEQRWAAFCRRAVEEIGVRSMLSFRLCMHGGTAGVLNLYGRHPAVFDEYSQAVGGLLAAHAAIALSAVREQERADHLEDALRSSREIGMAIGVLMGRDTMTRETAFGLLRQTSQHLNRKLREIAAEVVDTGQLPGRPLPRQRK